MEHPTQPGIGHTLFAVKEDKLLPVRFHSTKLKDNYTKWSPCKIEALGLATAIEAEYNILRESKHPVLIMPDNKAVMDAVNLINLRKVQYQLENEQLPH